MQPNPMLGVFLHAVGGFAAASFYLPFKGVRNWRWESYWLVGGFFSWLVAPLLGASLVCPDLWGTLRDAPPASLWWTYFFGVLWGVGGLTFGLSMRYLGLSLGYAMSLGFCAAFGTIIPPIFQGSAVRLVSTVSGFVTLAGVAVCLAGIAVCGLAGVRKEKELPGEEKQAAIREFDFAKGLWVAIFAGVMSACMAFALAAGKPIGEVATSRGTPPLFANMPVLVIALAGGFTTNFVWCAWLNRRNRSASDYLDAQGASLTLNYLLSALAGVTWYLQFFFYGMGTTRMGVYDFSSWTIHMAFIIAFSNVWGLALHEWRGVRAPTRHIVLAGIGILVLSTMVVGYGNYLGSR